MKLAVALQCGHVTFGEVGPDWFTCPDCSLSVKPQAFETREWHAKCNTCRYGRWFGQDKAAAQRAHKQHFCSIHYAAYPAKKEKVREIYGRKVRILIPDLIVPARWPEMRTNLIPVTPDLEIPPF